MTRDEIDILWQQAMTQAVKDGEMFTRYEFAALVAAAEREACAQVCDAASEPRSGHGQTDEQWAASTLAERIRARSKA